MARVKVAQIEEAVSVEIEVARLRSLDLEALRARWHTTVGKRPAAHLPKHLLFRMLAYRLQANEFRDLDSESRNILDRSDSPEQAGKEAAVVKHRTRSIRPGTVLGREWNGQMHSVAVLADGFAWDGKTYQSLSQVAHAITGTRWNGPRFFGLRDKAASAGT
jgi:Protein of unknown function (DUF2924)